FLSEHPTLTVDTALYDADFKDALLAALSDRDGGLAGQMDGLLIHGENFQALTLLQEAYREKVKCIYIDPPYNTGNDGFVYKDAYQHSTWLAMMEDRIRSAREMLTEDGAIAVSMDDHESDRVRLMMDEVFGKPNFIAQIVVQSNPRGRQSEEHVATTHEYLVLYARNIEECETSGLPLSEDQLEEYKYKDEKGRQYRLLGLRQRGAASRREDRPKMYFPLYVDPKTGLVSAHRTVKHKAEVLPKKSTGEDGRWAWSTQKVERNLDRLEARLIEGRDEWDIFVRDYLDTENGERTTKFKSIWLDKGINYQYGKTVLKDLFGRSPFEYPKPVLLVEHIVTMMDGPTDVYLDFFVGSGTTAHAVIDVNRGDNGNRKYVLVEQDKYFDTALKPRVQKVIYASEWEDGQPIEGSPGSSHAFQYLRLESYEDTLDNLDLRPELAPPPGLFPPEADDYLLKYMLAHETRALRLNVRAFETPFDYQLRVRRDGVETRVKVDLLETANFLLGLTVQVRRDYRHQKRTYRVVFGGTREGDSVAVIWRNTAGLDLQKEAEFVAGEILAEREVDRLYVNGDSRVAGA
ncbi:MAG: site-specific DNA-methyltransferase, partial [Chloroflexota bacterium]